MKEQPDLKNWWKEWRLIVGILLILGTVILGFYGKALVIVKYYEPVYLITGISLWILSWVLMFAGVFLVGKGTIRMIKNWIQKEIRNAVTKSYDATTSQAKRGYNYTKELHKKGIEKWNGTKKAGKNG